MQENNNHIKTYSATDIQQYLQGKLSDRAMHDLEKAALDDPFLADAIEGMQQQEQAAYNTGMLELAKRLKNRTAEKNKSNPFFLLPRSSWWKAAAILLVIAGAGGPLYIFLFRNREAKSSISAAKQDSINTDRISKNSGYIGSAATAKTDSSVRSYIPATAMRDVAANKKPFKVTDKEIKSEPINDRVMATRQESLAKKAAVGDTAFAKAGLLNLRADSLPSSVAANSPPGIETALAGRAAGVEVTRQRNGNHTNFFEGTILDEYKKPIAGATVKMKNRKTATITDNYGAFKLNTGSKDSLVNVVVQSVGFQPASFVLTRADTAANTIQLQSNSSALNEVVVVGYGVQRKRNLTAEDSTALDSIALRQQEEPEVQAMPVIGWEEYNAYLNKNKRITTADSTRKGKEIISFLLDQKGKRSDFKIKKSLSPAHDAEAIRLVKEGPTWQLLSGKKTRIRVTVEF